MAAEITGQRWIHSYEEDGAEGQVYRPDTWDFPLSRRPREALELESDGRARLFLPGEEDRPRQEQASWKDENGIIVVRATSAGGRRPTALRIVESCADRLLVRR
ncbi:MAG: hypothetical protein OEN50_09155 [Deltaproteobacteria bacterium]|nr:hypothetical protein [Deltaproteobacteria bacterium]